MKLSSLFVLLGMSTSLLAVDTIPNVCYEKLGGGQFCTTDNVGKVQVFVFNAGWCPPCNTEVGQLSRDHSQFAGKNVVFASLSGHGYQKPSQPDQAFMTSWQKKHNIPFVVAGKYNDFGKSFGANGYIPFTAIINQQGEITNSGNLEAAEIIREVKQLLGE